MTTLALLLLPPALLLGFLVVRRLMGKPVRRHTTNVLLAILALAYFGATAALGIFWVARQDLPPFDLHYTVGYVALLLVAIHVAYNYRALDSLVFGRWRGPVRPLGVALPGLVLAIAMLAVVAFAAGYQRGVQKLTIHLAGDSTSDRHLVETASGTQGLAVHYHRSSALRRYGLGDPSVDWGARPAVYQGFPGADLVPLPPSRAGVTSIAEARSRQPAGGFAPDGALSLADLAHLLYLANGVTDERREMRAAASAGALYPTVTYVLASRVDGLDPGLYHYAVDAHALHRLDPGAATHDLALHVLRGHLVEDAAATVLLTARFERTTWKYRARSYRYVLLDAGHLAANLALAAASLDLDTAMLDTFDDVAVARVLGVDGVAEAPLLAIPVGPGAAREPPEYEPEFRARRGLALDEGTHLVQLAHLGTSLELAAHGPPEPPSESASPAGTGDIALPPPLPLTTPVAETIASRRSRRSYSRQPMDLDALGSLLQGLPPRGDLSVFLFARRIDGLERGLYRVDAGSLTLLRAGGSAIGAAAIGQEVVADAHGVLAFALEYRHLDEEPGERSYRSANLLAGRWGEALYLNATALDLAVCGVGAFYDDEVAGLLGLDPEEWGVLHLVAFGRR